MKAIITSTLFFWFPDLKTLCAFEGENFLICDKERGEGVWKVNENAEKKFLLIYFRLWKWLSHFFFLYHDDDCNIL